MSEAFLDLECNAKKMGLVGNENKTKYMVSDVNHTTKTDIQIGERVNQIPYIDTTIQMDNNTTREIKH